jgi:hypothetical protein
MKKGFRLGSGLRCGLMQQCGQAHHGDAVRIVEFGIFKAVAAAAAAAAAAPLHSITSSPLLRWQKLHVPRSCCDIPVYNFT